MEMSQRQPGGMVTELTWPVTSLVWMITLFLMGALMGRPCRSIASCAAPRNALAYRSFCLAFLIDKKR